MGRIPYASQATSPEKLERFMTSTCYGFHHTGTPRRFAGLAACLLALAAMVALAGCGEADGGSGGTRTTGFAVALTLAPQG